MKNIFNYIFLIALISIFAACNTKNEINLKECNTFVAAKPVWAEGRETERNLTRAFREIIETGKVSDAYIRLTASCDYRMRINSEFVSHGPCVAAHDYYRMDCIDIKPYLKPGKNIVAIEVAGYNFSDSVCETWEGTIKDGQICATFKAGSRTYEFTLTEQK
jgi:hypothetical protein